MVYKIMCNPVYPLDGARPRLYVPVRVTHGALATHRYTYALLCCRTSQYRRAFIPSQCLSGTILLTQFSNVWDWRVSRQGQFFFIGLSCFIPTIVFFYFSLSLLSVYRLVLWGWGLRSDRVHITLSQPCSADLFYDNNKS